jgi:hypothetical protein
VKKLPLTAHVCTEKKLIVCCACKELPPSLAERLRELARNPLDWDFLLEEAANNSVTPLIARHVLDYARDLVDPRAVAALQEAARAAAVRCLVLTTQLMRLMDGFRAEGLLAIPYKGPVIAAQAYGDATLREFADLDVILRHRDITKANDVMVGLGLRLRFPSLVSPRGISSIVPGEYNYRDQSGRVVVDLHTERTMRHFPRQPDLDELTERLAPVDVGGRSVSTFSLEDQLPILCIHGAKDFWERIVWIADIAELIRSRAELDWDLVVRRAETLRARRMLRLGLALAQKLLDEPLPQEIRREVSNDKIADSVAANLVRMHLSRQARSKSAVQRFEFRRRMMPQTCPGLRYAVRLAFAPAEEDWLMMRLPRPLTPLYFALRPMRLLRKYGVSSAILSGEPEYSRPLAKN